MATKTTTKKTTSAKAPTQGGATLSSEEKAAIKERAAEAKAARSGKADGLQALLDKLAEMSPTDRELAEAVHRIVTETAPELEPRTYYGMPAYAKDGTVLVFFQNAGKFKARYSTLGFNDKAALDDGDMWPTSYALTVMTPAVEKQVAALVRKAAG